MANFSSFICSQHDIQQQSLTTMVKVVSALNPKYSSEPVSTFSRVSSDSQDHTKALEIEISRIANTIPNPVCRSLFELGINNALQEILGLGRLGRVSFDKEMEPTDVHILQREQENNGTTTNYTASKQPFWIARNVRRNDFVLKNFVGTFYVRSRTNVLEYSHAVDRVKDGNDYKYEHVTSFCACPAPWLVKLGVNYGLKLDFHSSAIWGWKYTLDTFCQVPDTAMIFDFCKEGNISGVQTLLSRGRASVRDTDSWGRTPLYVSGSEHFSSFHRQQCFIYSLGGQFLRKANFLFLVCGKKSSNTTL